jgi:hypothetical protein
LDSFIDFAGRGVLRSHHAQSSVNGRTATNRVRTNRLHCGKMESNRFQYALTHFFGVPLLVSPNVYYTDERSPEVYQTDAPPNLERIGSSMRIRHVDLLAASCALCVVFLSTTAHAEPPTQSSAEANRPTSLTAVVGDVLIRIDGPKLWTLSGIDFQNTVMAVQDSAYGSVINIRGVGYLGSAHFLDVPGKPGAVEKEIVSSVKFFVDDQPVTAITPTMNLAGKSFLMERQSQIRSVALESSVSVREGSLFESVRLRTAVAVDLKIAYPLMYAWTPNATAYLFGDDTGIQKRGTFVTAPGKPGEGLEKTARWMAVYSGQNGKGAVCHVVQHPAKVETWLQYTDAPGVYRKLRVMSFADSTLPAGFDGTFQTAVGFFTATETDWEAKAQQRLLELKSLAKR